MTFHGKHRMSEHALREAHESPLVMLVPLFILAFGAALRRRASSMCCSSATVHDLFWANKALRRPPFWRCPTHTALEAREHVPEWVHWAPFILTVGGFVISYYFYIMRPDLAAKIGESAQAALSARQEQMVFRRDLRLSDRPPDPAAWPGSSGKAAMAASSTGSGPDGISSRVLDGTQFFVKLQTGYLYHYAFADADRHRRGCHLLHLADGRRRMMRASSRRPVYSS